jgi:thiamine pyrophosphate-dependent acetolactate synthase large subunit-like protein
MGSIPPSWADALLHGQPLPVFGLAGSSNLRFLAQHRANGGQVIQAQHEAAAVAMATGWAEATGRVGVASVHQGPGFTNTITALIDAHRGWLPLVLVTGHTNDPMHHQGVDTIGLCDRLGIAAVSPPTGNSEELVNLLHESASARCPIVVLPPDPTSARPQFVVPAKPAVLDAIPDVILRRLNGGERIAIVAGRGAVRTNALPALAQLAEYLDALLLTTLPAHGAFAGNPRYAGSMGGFASAGTTSALQSCDLVLTFGAGLDRWSTAGGRMFSDEACVLRVDPISTTQDERVIALPMDAGTAARQLRGLLTPRTATTWAPQAAALGRRTRTLGEPTPGLDPRLLLAELDRLLPAHRRLVLDSGHFIALAAMYLTTLDGPHLLFGQDFQSVGLGLAKAIGAASATDDRLTVAIIGDGGAAMSLLEIATAVDLQLPLLVVIINDAAYGAEVHDFQPLGVDVSVAQSTLRNWAGVAGALGATAHSVRSIADLEPLRSWLSSPQGPLVLDCQVNPAVDATSVMTDEGLAEWSCAE